MYKPGYGDEDRDYSEDGLAPYGAAAAVGSGRDECDTDMDDHAVVGLCGDDHIGGCLL